MVDQSIRFLKRFALSERSAKNRGERDIWIGEVHRRTIYMISQIRAAWAAPPAAWSELEAVDRELAAPSGMVIYLVLPDEIPDCDGRLSAESRLSSSGSVHHWEGLASRYSSCQFHHLYGGVWG
jgi:hypothetical protein